MTFTTSSAREIVATAVVEAPRGPAWKAWDQPGARAARSRDVTSVREIRWDEVLTDAPHITRSEHRLTNPCGTVVAARVRTPTVDTKLSGAGSRTTSGIGRPLTRT